MNAQFVAVARTHETIRYPSSSVRVERPLNLCGFAYAASIFLNVKLFSYICSPG